MQTKYWLKVAKRDLETTSQNTWDEAWKKSLAEGRCIYGCAIESSTCKHLDEYLSFTPTGRAGTGVSLVFTDAIEDFADDGQEQHPVWNMFKKLRKYPLSRDQIGILVRKYGAGMTNRQILDEMNWTSHSALSARLKSAIRVLKQRGFKP